MSVSHDHPRFSDPEFHPLTGGFACDTPRQTCAGCTDPVPMDRLEQGYCKSCRQLCPICGDWLMGEPETTVTGHRTHTACMEVAQ